MRSSWTFVQRGTTSGCAALRKGAYLLSTPSRNRTKSHPRERRNTQNHPADHSRTWLQFVQYPSRSNHTGCLTRARNRQCTDVVVTKGHRNSSHRATETSIPWQRTCTKGTQDNSSNFRMLAELFMEPLLARH